MSKRVCIVRQNYFPAEAHVRKNVDALVDAGFEVDVVCLRDRGEAATENYRGATVYRVPLAHRRTSPLRYLFEYAAFFVMSFAVLAYRSLRERYQTVEVYNIPDFLVFAALPAKLFGSRIVFYMFELMPEQTGDNYGLADDHRAVRFLRWIEKRATAFAHRVVVVSPYQKQVVVDRSPPRAEPTIVMNVPADKLFVAPNRNGAEHDEPFRIMTHGSILRRYGIQTLIRAVPHLVDEIPDLEVTVLGEGEYRADLEQLARELDVAGHVHFRGWIPHEDVAGVIATADLGIVPMSIPWILPNKLFEYVAMERPVVISDSPSLDGLFDDMALARFRPDDERDLARRVLELHADRELGRRLARRARELYQSYRWQEVSKRYVGLHEELSRTARTEGRRSPDGGVA